MMDANNEDTNGKKPGLLLTKMRHLASRRGCDNPAMTPVQEVTEVAAAKESNIHKANSISFKSPEVSTSAWVFTLDKDKRANQKPGEKSFDQSWATIERYLEERKTKPIVRRQKCPCVTRKCKFVTGVGFLGALVLIAIILIAYFVVITKKGDLQPKQQPKPSQKSPASLEQSNGEGWMNYQFDDDWLDHPNATSHTNSTKKAPTVPRFTTERSAVLATTTGSQQSTVPSVNVTDQNSADLMELLMLPGPLQRLFG